MPSPRLFSPIKVGNCQLEHRVVLAPLTRFRAEGHLPQPNMIDYYGQRASKGGLLITEATFISHEAGGYPNAPGIWSDAQVEAWKPVTRAVHQKEGSIFMQLWALGRANTGHTDVPRVVSASALVLTDGEERVTPEPLTVEEIQQYVTNYAKAAENAVAAGFDGIELHGANGYLLHQFIESGSNQREDNYGGSLENRARFLFEAVEATSKAIGQEKVALRLSPYTAFQGMGKEPNESYVWICQQLKERFPKLAYVHFFEDVESTTPKSSDQFRSVWRKPTPSGYEEPTADSPTVIITCGGYERQTALDVCEAKGDLIAVGRHFIANPDLPLRWLNNYPLTKYDRSTFYSPGDVGYIDYAFYGEKGHGEKVAEQKANL